MRTAVLRQIARTLIPEPVLRARYQWYFFRAKVGPMQLGKFDSLDEARALLSAKGRDGRYAMDQAAWFAERSSTYFSHDYPVLFWLSRLIHPGSRLVDLGGSTGVTYRLFRPRLALPPDFEWQVQELPAVIDYARSLGDADQAPHLSFTDDWKAIDGAAIVLSAGALQFFPQRLSTMLAEVHDRPTHILLNRVPLTENGASFFTLQNTGVAIAPMRVESRSAFLADMAAYGYELIDAWKCLENSLVIPYHHEYDLSYFHGFYFRQPECRESRASVVVDRATARASTPRPARGERRKPRHPVLHPVTPRRAAPSSVADRPRSAIVAVVRMPRGHAVREESAPGRVATGRARGTGVPSATALRARR